MIYPLFFFFFKQREQREYEEKKKEGYPKMIAPKPVFKENYNPDTSDDDDDNLPTLPVQKKMKKVKKPQPQPQVKGNDTDSEVEVVRKKRKVTKIVYESDSCDENQDPEPSSVPVKKNKKALMKVAKSFINDEASCNYKDIDDEDEYEDDIEQENDVVTKTVNPSKVSSFSPWI